MSQGQDAFADREDISFILSGGQYIALADTPVAFTAMTTQGGEPTPIDGEPASLAHTMWASFTVPSDVTGDTAEAGLSYSYSGGTPPNIAVAVYTGSVLGSLTKIASGEVSSGTTLTVPFTASPGATYIVQISAWGTIDNPPNPDFSAQPSLTVYQGSVVLAKRKLFAQKVTGVEIAPGPPPATAGFVVSFTVKFDATYLDKTLNGGDVFTGAVLAFSSDLLFFGQEVFVVQKSGGTDTEYQFGVGFGTPFRFGPVLTPGQTYQIDVKEDTDAETTTVRIDGVEYVVDVSGVFLPGENDWNSLHFGHWDGPHDMNGTKDMDDISIGTGTTYGATDILATYGFDAALVPPFDSETDPDNRLTISSGLLHWHGATFSVDDAYVTIAI